MTSPTKKRQTIKSLAAQIKAEFPNLMVRVTQGYRNTDRKPKGLRYITRKGKGRTGDHITVRDPMSFPEGDRDAVFYGGEKLLDHNNAETYRTTSEVADWLDRYRASRKGKRR